MDHDTRQQTAGRARSVGRYLSRLSIEHLWMLVPALVVTWGGSLHQLRLLDFWWHLKVGEVMVTSGRIPRVDLFSFTRAGQPFIYQNWLGEVLYYGAYRVGGVPLLIMFNTMLLLLAFVPVLYLCREASQRPPVASLCSLVAAIVLALFGSMRPQVYSFALFSTFYWILWQYRDRRRDWLWALPPLMMIWVNLHGAFVLGLGLIALVLVTEAIRRALRGPHPETMAPSALARLALILALTVVASVANPQGYGVYAYVRQLQVDPASQAFVTEWQVPDVKELAGIVTFFAPFFLSLLLFFYTGSPLSLTELGLFLTFAAFGLAAHRNGIWFALIVTPMLARHASGLRVRNVLEGSPVQSYLRRLARLRVRPRQGRQRTRYALNWVILIGLLLFTVALSPWVRPRLQVKRLSPQLVDRGTPVGAMDYIASQHLVGNMFHPQRYGDYLIWRLWPEQRSFVDGRVHLYEQSFVQDYVLTFHDENWESRLAKYEIRYLLLPKDDDNAQSMIEDARASESWLLLYEDDITVLFEKT